MVKYFMAFILAFGLLTVGFSMSAYANGNECYTNADCPSDKPDDFICLEYQHMCVYGEDGPGMYCSYDYLPELGCIHEFDSRGDCVSSGIGYHCAGLKGQDRKACNASVKAFCDCAVNEGCTDKPNGPPEEE